MAIQIRLESGEFAIDAWPVGIVVLAILLVMVWHRKHNLPYLVCFSVFSVYLLIALDKTFFPLPISGSYADAMRQQASFTSFINLIPFYFGPFGTLSSAVSTMILNVILTIPFGFGVNFVTQVRAKRFLWLAPAIGFGIEAAQLAVSLMLGYPYRVVDINDVLMNAVGIWIGYGSFRIFAWLYLWAAQYLGIGRSGMTGVE